MGNKIAKRRLRQVPGEVYNKKNNVSDAIGSALAIDGVLDRVMGYLSSKQRHQTCVLVSKQWKKAVVEGSHFPLSLRIEDTVYDVTDKTLPPNGYCCKDEKDNETFVYPLYAIGNLPSWVAAKTTKLVLVLRFARKFSSKYDLNDFWIYQGRPSWFLDRFRNLQELTIISEFASDQFVSILAPPPAMIRQRTRIPSLKKIHYEETNVSNWRNSYLKTFVELAPNLESLIVRENMRWKWKEGSLFFQAEHINDLLPLSGSLRKLILFNRPNIRGNFGKFLAKMPHLQSWDIFKSRMNMGYFPRTVGRIPRPQTFEDNAYRKVDLNEHPHFVHYALSEAEFILTMQDVLVPWFLGLDDANIHPWKNKIPDMVGYLDTIMKEYFEADDQFSESRPARPYRLPTLSNLLEVDTSVLCNNAPYFYGGRKHGNYCCASRTKTKLQNYHHVVRPCMELYYNEFVYYCEARSLGGGYSKLQKLQQKRELKRLVKNVTRVEDHYRKGVGFWFGKVPKGKDFGILV